MLVLRISTPISGAQKLPFVNYNHKPQLSTQQQRSSPVLQAAHPVASLASRKSPAASSKPKAVEEELKHLKHVRPRGWEEREHVGDMRGGREGLEEGGRPVWSDWLPQVVVPKSRSAQDRVLSEFEREALSNQDKDSVVNKSFKVRGRERRRRRVILAEQMMKREEKELGTWERRRKEDGTGNVLERGVAEAKTVRHRNPSLSAVYGFIGNAAA
eukprot:755752-Hanusia_phi.AAC.1